MKEILEPEKEPLTKERARQVLFYSFYFSQGFGERQEDLFKYIHLLRPDWRCDEETQPAKEFNTSIMRLSSQGLHTGRSPRDRAQARSEWSDQYVSMYFCLNKEKVEDKDEVLLTKAETLRNTIFSDYHYLIDRLGRRRRHNDPAKPMQDNRLSQFCHYIALGNKCGVPVFDEMFAELKTHWETLSEVFRRPVMYYPDYFQKVRNVVNEHNKHHAKKVVLPSGFEELL